MVGVLKSISKKRNCSFRLKICRKRAGNDVVMFRYDEDTEGV